jgi:hypothetical protein
MNFNRTTIFVTRRVALVALLVCHLVMDWWLFTAGVIAQKIAVPLAVGSFVFCASICICLALVEAEERRKRAGETDPLRAAHALLLSLTDEVRALESYRNFMRYQLTALLAQAARGQGDNQILIDARWLEDPHLRDHFSAVLEKISMYAVYAHDPCAYCSVTATLHWQPKQPAATATCESGASADTGSAAP